MFNKTLATRISFIAILVAITIFFGGMWITSAYAQVSLPGDALYSVKTGLEDVQVSLSVDASKDANLHLQFAEFRLNEMDRLIEKGRFEDLDVASGKFEYHIQEAIKSLAAVAASDPEQARTMALSVNDALSRSTGILTQLIAAVPETAQPAIEHAILASEAALEASEIEFTGKVDSIGPESWVISGLTVLVNEYTELDDLIGITDQVNVEGVINSDGTITAEEIELVDEDPLNENDGDANENLGDDMNENVGDDMNENVGDDTNENVGDDMNENVGDDMNENVGDDMNENVGDDMNENVGDDMNENVGDDMNENVGEHMNENVGDDMNENDNDDLDNDNDGGGNDND